MEPPKILSGEELVARGITKLDASLPEVGLKDVIPNGSWLEQKQIQSALEARKHLIAVERIEKHGTPSHAVWRDDLMLAEVTKMAGGHWQYLGHNVGKTLFLRPEETLYLMEVNCLLLTHNEVTVSLQKAYSLLLHSPTNLMQYRVYASLSRLGYKVLIHKANEINKCKAEKCTQNTVNDQNMVIDSTVERKDPELNINNNTDKNFIAEENKTIDSNISSNKENNVPTEVSELEPIIREDETDERKTVVTNNNTDTETISSIVTESHTNKDCEETAETGTRKRTLDIMDTSPGKSNTADLGVQINTERNLNKTDVVTATEITQMDTDDGNQSTESLMEVEHIENSATSICRNSHTNIRSSEKLLRRQKPCNAKTLSKHFECLPVLSKQQVVIINVPNQEYIPKNIFVNENTYTLYLSNIRNKTSNSISTESAYNSTDEVNGTHVRRISGSSATDLTQNSVLTPNLRPPTQPFYFRPYSFWRPQNNINFYQFSMFLQRPSFPNMFMQSRFQFQSRSPPYMRPFSRHFIRPFTYPNPVNHNLPTAENLQKKSNHSRSLYLREIKQLAERLKQLIASGSRQIENITSLKSLLYSYNLRYKTKLRLTENCDIVNDEKILETIELDDEEEPKSKKARVEEDVTYERNLSKLKNLAETLKDLENNEKSTARHRRAFSNAIRSFNKSYSAELYLNGDMELIDKRFINLDSSSESDCVVKETKTVRKKKKLRNPFNILKRLSQQLELETNQGAANNKNLENNDISLLKDTKYDENITKSFNENWLPNEKDFGRAEVVSKDYLKSRLIDSSKEIFIYDFIRDHYPEFNSWLEAKTSFVKHIEDTDIAIRKEQTNLLAQSKAEHSDLKPLIEFEDCTNMQTVLETIRIIKNNKNVTTATDLAVDFDVYNRDVQNFRKTNPPKPHFRIICLEESSRFPSTAEVSTLQSKYKDEVPNVFAIVSIASVSYIQLNPIELPVYVPANDTS